jgi:hypothetical protein
MVDNNSIDYFIGVDSVGQHFAKACEKPGTVILGATFAENISYSKHFQIFEKEGAKKYAPLRINSLECHLADRSNDVRMDFTDKEIDKLVKMIEKDIRVNNEFYVCPVFNQAIQDNKKIKTFSVKKMWGLGTPEDLDNFINLKK